MDIILSNCVVNLSPDKARVLAEAYRVLRPGGEFYFSDVYSDRRVPAEAQQNEVITTLSPVPADPDPCMIAVAKHARQGRLILLDVLDHAGACQGTTALSVFPQRQVLLCF